MPMRPDLGAVAARLERLPENVERVVLTDNHAATARVSPLAAVAAVLESGRSCTVCASTRDRNRLALFAHVTGAVALGADEVLCVGGDAVDQLPPPDLRPTDLIERAAEWVDGRARVGACCAARLAPHGTAGALTRRKVEAGASFVVTQALYDGDRGRRLVEAIGSLGAEPVVGVPLVTSSGGLAALARFAGEPPQWVGELVARGDGPAVTRRLLAEIDADRAHIYPIGEAAWVALAEAIEA